jgi:hypothetical protein
MGKIEQYSRILHHRSTVSGQQFTVPTSNDHTDETWLSTDLYVGEIGMNITDDTLFFRTNNGIVQIATGTSSGAGSSASSIIWNWSSPNIIIGSTYSASSVSPRSGYYTDLGTSTLRWKDLYLGGSSTGLCGINVNGGITLTEISSNGILTSGYMVNDNAPIKIGVGTVSNSTNMSRTLSLNSKDVSMTQSGNQRVVIAANGIILGSNNDNILVQGTNVTIDDGVSQHAHLGYGYNKTNYDSNSVVASNLAVRGAADDGSYQYIRADWRTNQAVLRTSNALTTTLASIPWEEDGNVIQIKAYIIGTRIDDASKVYSAEIMTAVYGGASYTAAVVGSPVLNAVSSFTGNQPDCEITVDGSGAYIKVTGLASTTIQWQCTYSHHRLINVIP